MGKVTMKERFDAFVDELKKDYPLEESDELVESFVIVGVEPDGNGGTNHFGICKGNPISICAALTALFEKPELVEMLEIAAGFKEEQLKRKIND